MGNLLTCVHRPNSGGDPWRQTPVLIGPSITDFTTLELLIDNYLKIDPEEEVWIVIDKHA